MTLTKERLAEIRRYCTEGYGAGHPMKNELLALLDAAEDNERLKEALERVRDLCCYCAYDPCGCGNRAIEIAEDALSAEKSIGLAADKTRPD